MQNTDNQLSGRYTFLFDYHGDWRCQLVHSQGITPFIIGAVPGLQNMFAVKQQKREVEQPKKIPHLSHR